MKFKITTFFIAVFFIHSAVSAQKTINLNANFDKIIVSPHIEVVFKKGNEASIVVEDINVPVEKFQYELIKGTLQVYLEGAKTYTKNKKIVQGGGKRKVPLYKGRVVKLIITYVDVNIFSVRGEDKITFETPLIQKTCKLRIYGKSEVTIHTINVENLAVTIYGDSFLNMEKGQINKQKITAYGESKVMASEVVSREAKIRTYGSGTFKLNVTDRIKVTSYGEATVLYSGNASLKNGVIIGESTIKKVF
jgi:hypothetical protein